MATNTSPELYPSYIQPIPDIFLVRLDVCERTYIDSVGHFPGLTTRCRCRIEENRGWISEREWPGR